MTFESFAKKYLDQKGIPRYEGSLLSLDPGGTTGWAYFKDLQLITCGELDTSDIGIAGDEFKKLITDFNVTEIVYEDYRVYKWKTAQHAGSDLHTTRIIGSIETIAHQSGIPWTNQPAHVAKGFCHDKRLKEWEVYQVGLKHARDAIRHGCYYILFGSIKAARTKTRNPITVG